MASTNLRPLGDRVLVEAAEEKETKKGGIIIPDSAKEKPMEGVVVALGTGKTDENGKKVIPSKSRRATACSCPSTAAPRSSSTARNTRS
jgi:hypothetical protein